MHNPYPLITRYRELEEEHEDLLSLLAQQEVEKTAITTLLLKLTGGQGALLEAKKLAEEECMKKFGVYIPSYHDDDDDDGLASPQSMAGNPSSLAHTNHSSHVGHEGGGAGAGGGGIDHSNALLSPTGIKSSGVLFGNDDNYEEFEDDLKDL
jgi:hypothetical protein